MSLSGPSREPLSGGVPRHLVVLMHGVAADGSDLIGLAPVLAQQLPDAAFLAPDAPQPCDMAPFGRQWFSLQNRDPAVLCRGADASAPLLAAFIEKELAERNLSAQELALVGFSQGTMMALRAGLAMAEPPAAILGFSGALLQPVVASGRAVERTAVMLVHGDADEVVPFGALAAAQTALTAARIAVETMARPGLGHAIDPEGLVAGLAFLTRRLRPERTD